MTACHTLMTSWRHDMRITLEMDDGDAVVLDGVVSFGLVGSMRNAVGNVQFIRHLVIGDKFELIGQLEGAKALVAAWDCHGPINGHPGNLDGVGGQHPKRMVT